MLFLTLKIFSATGGIEKVNRIAGKALYEISNYNKQKGIKPWLFNKGRKFLSDTKKSTAYMKKIDKTI